MAELKVFHDCEGQTLTVWFADPSQEYVCEETGDKVVLIKDRSGRVIGFEEAQFHRAGIRLGTRRSRERACPRNGVQKNLKNS
jgi:hypothetical protein